MCSRSAVQPLTASVFVSGGEDRRALARGHHVRAGPRSQPALRRHLREAVLRPRHARAPASGRVRGDA
eukprot:8603638-Pyramimonas_sp.AAC.2